MIFKKIFHSSNFKDLWNFDHHLNELIKFLSFIFEVTKLIIKLKSFINSNS